MTNESLLAITENCKSLISLSLQYCELLEPTEVAVALSLLDPLVSLNLTGNVSLDDSVLNSIIQQHGSQIQTLSLNGLDEITIDSLASCSKSIPNLEIADFSWIRSVDDIYFKEIMTKCRRLQRISLYGCNQISRYLLDEVWINGEGRQIIILGNEYD